MAQASMAQALATSHASFTLADLGKLNESCSPTSTMAMWMDEGQRDGVWDAVGYVKGENSVEQSRGQS
jgi:hypothetical protein